MASRKQIKKVAADKSSPRYQAAKRRLEANSPLERAKRQAKKAHGEGHFRFK